jgi:hypothetical protein
MSILTVQQRERMQMVQIARSDIELAVLKIVSERGLTYAEINSVLGQVVTNFASYAIRDERNPAA